MRRSVFSKELLDLGGSAPLFHRFNRQWIQSPSSFFVGCYWVLAESGWTCWSLKSVVPLVTWGDWVHPSTVSGEGNVGASRSWVLLCGRLRTWVMLRKWWIFAAFRQGNNSVDCGQRHVLWTRQLLNHPDSLPQLWRSSIRSCHGLHCCCACLDLRACSQLVPMFLLDA
jgi:hypothetical protein